MEYNFELSPLFDMNIGLLSPKISVNDPPNFDKMFEKVITENSEVGENNGADNPIQYHVDSIPFNVDPLPSVTWNDISSIPFDTLDSIMSNKKTEVVNNLPVNISKKVPLSLQSPMLIQEFNQYKIPEKLGSQQVQVVTQPSNYQQNLITSKPKEVVLDINKNGVLKEKKKRRRRRKKKKELSAEDLIPDEDWQNIFMSEDMIVPLKADPEIMCKTRCEEATTYVPTVLYSSLKYELQTKLQFKRKIKDEAPFVMAKIKVIHADTFKEMEKNGKPVIKGDIEGALSAGKNNKIFTGKLKVQFTSVSYHHKKHLLRWEIHFFFPSDLEEPFLIMRSSEFKVFARRPSKGGTKKRKRTQMDIFNEKLNELVISAKKLKLNEKNVAYESISKKLVELDNGYFNCLK